MNQVTSAAIALLLFALIMPLIDLALKNGRARDQTSIRRVHGQDIR